MFGSQFPVPQFSYSSVSRATGHIVHCVTGEESSAWELEWFIKGGKNAVLCCGERCYPFFQGCLLGKCPKKDSAEHRAVSFILQRGAETLEFHRENCLLMVFSNFYIVLSCKIPHEYAVLICLSYRGYPIVCHLLKSGFCFLTWFWIKNFVRYVIANIYFFQSVTCLSPSEVSFTKLKFLMLMKLSVFSLMNCFTNFALLYAAEFFYRHFIILCITFRSVIYLTLLCVWVMK